MFYARTIYLISFPYQQSHQHKVKCRQKININRRRKAKTTGHKMWCEPGTNPTICGEPLINSSFIFFKVQHRKRERERQYIYNRSQHFDLSRSSIRSFRIAMRSVEDILLQLILKVTPSPIILHLVLLLHHNILHHATLIMIIIMLPMFMILSCCPY